MNELAHEMGKQAAWKDYVLYPALSGALGAGVGALFPDDRLENMLSWGLGGAAAGLSVPLLRQLGKRIGMKAAPGMVERANVRLRDAGLFHSHEGVAQESQRVSKKLDFLAELPNMVLAPVVGLGTAAGTGAAVRALRNEEKTSGFGEGYPSLPEGYVPFGYTSQTKPIHPTLIREAIVVLFGERRYSPGGG